MKPIKFIFFFSLLLSMLFVAGCDKEEGIIEGPDGHIAGTKFKNYELMLFKDDTPAEFDIAEENCILIVERPEKIGGYLIYDGEKFPITNLDDYSHLINNISEKGRKVILTGELVGLTIPFDAQSGNRPSIGLFIKSLKKK